MGLTTLFAESFHSLAKNKVRTALSVLGIVIGIGAVIAMVAIAEGAQRKVEREIQAIGDDWLIVGYWGMQRGGARRQGALPSNQTRDDCDAIMRDCPGVRAATPTNRMSMQAITSYGNYPTRVFGAYPNFFDIRRWKAVSGRVFLEEDQALRAKVCCIGQTAAKELFGGVDPVGEIVRVNKVAFEVIGVLEPKGMSSDGQDNDDMIVFPYYSFQRFIAGTERSATLLAAAKPGVPLSVAQEEIRAVLRQRHRVEENEPDPFRMFDRASTAQANAETTRTFNMLLTAIASISLLVGGVGIMNIMLVSVTERTREIGLRMAIGAKGRHILGQFLCESIVLCSLGGLLGLAAGVGAAQFVATAYKEAGWEADVSYWMAALAIAFSTAVGVFFGFYPAWRASRLNPIEALRFE